MGTEIGNRLERFIAFKRLSKRRFQSSIGVSNSYIQNMSKGMSVDILNRISSTYPELNTDWLLTGEGEMLNPAGVHQSVKGDGNTTVAGNGNNINITMLESMMTEMTKQREMFQSQIDRLLSVIEKLQTNNLHI